MAQGDLVELPALGRPFQLGMLYDCRSDALIPGITLWDLQALQKDLSIRPQPKTESEVIASDSIDDKASALGVSTSLKASFLGGLVEVGGSAKYLHDSKTSRQQARVTLQYKATTRYEQLTMSHLGIQNVSYPAVFEHGTATHVVTAVLYGAQAFFVFDREASSSETVKDLQGSLQVMIGKFVSTTGEAEIEMNEKEKSYTENFKCKFHGDFSLDKNPVSFEDAIRVYARLPKMLGDDGKRAVPVRVWLYPLTKLDSRAAKLVRDISLSLIFDAQALMEQLNEVKMRCNDLARSPVTDAFPEVKRKIEQFEDLCKQHRQTFQKQLASVLPSIRGGGKEEGALADILASIGHSPFNSQRLGEFLDAKEREISFVKSYLAILSGVEVISSWNKLEEVVLDPRNEFVVSFTFTSLHDEELFLFQLQRWLQRAFPQPGDDPGAGATAPGAGKAWFEHQEKVQKARKAARSVADFARVNSASGTTRFVVASVPDGEHPGASIYLYEEGELISRCLELPPKPRPPLLRVVGHESVQLTFQPAAYGRASISGYRVEYKVTGEEGWGAASTEDGRETFLLEGLSPNTEYQLRYAARSKPGLSASSDPSAPVRTLPTSPPGKPREVTAEPSLISVAWESPSAVGVGAVIQEYKVEYREGAGEKSREAKGGWKEKRTAGKTEVCAIGQLKPQTRYRVRVSAVCADGAQSAPSEEVEVLTSPEEERESRLARAFLPKSTLLEKGPPSVYALPLQKATAGATRSCVTYQLGEMNLQVPSKVIMMMGATGSGKTALIDGMVNYILGVQWGDDFRFRLIHEETRRSQAESRTSEVTAYVLNHQGGFQVPFSLTVIDMPEFGDTAGAENVVARKVRRFLSPPGGISHVDALGLVVPASLARLSPTQKAVFDSVPSMFRADMRDNTLVLVTCADGQPPPVLQAVEEANVACARDASGGPVHFSFNTSALLASKSRDSLNFAEIFWKIGTSSMKTFFDSLDMLERKRLSLRNAVLREENEASSSVRRPVEPWIKDGPMSLQAPTPQGPNRRALGETDSGELSQPCPNPPDSALVYPKTPQFLHQDIMGHFVKGLAEIQVNCIHCIPSIQPSRNLVIEFNKVHNCGAATSDPEGSGQAMEVGRRQQDGVPCG
ncbi:Verrucotoxin subunit beta [Varanus komodoensis]|nr:Verrucotoxin subunit beta [Varanus komodoensis]